MGQGMRGYTVARKRLNNWFEKKGCTKAWAGRQIGRDGGWFSGLLAGRNTLGAEMIGPLSELTGIPEEKLLWPPREKQDAAISSWAKDRQARAGTAAVASLNGSKLSADGKKFQAKCTSCDGRGWHWKSVVHQEE